MGRIKVRGANCVHRKNKNKFYSKTFLRFLFFFFVFFVFFPFFLWFIIRFLYFPSLTERSWAPAGMSPFQHFSQFRFELIFKISWCCHRTFVVFCVGNNIIDKVYIIISNNNHFKMSRDFWGMNLEISFSEIHSSVILTI